MNKTSKTSIDNKVKNELEMEGELTHEELCDELNVTWDCLQKSIRRLRSQNKVRITLDRKYTLYKK